MGNVYLDLKGLLCPMPALMTARRLKTLRPGDVLVVEATDPMAEVDIGLLARERGLALAVENEEGALRFIITAGAVPD